MSLPNPLSSPIARAIVQHKKLFQKAIDAEKMRRSLRLFFKKAWLVADPSTPLIPNWHQDAICDHLQAVSEGKIKRLLINVPPGHAKSLSIAVIWPAWVWTWRPQWQALFASYSLSLATRDSVRCRALMESAWYRENFASVPRNGSEPRPAWELRDDANQKSDYSNTAGGRRLCVSTQAGAKTTGERGSCFVGDDLLSAGEAYSKASRDRANFYWNTVASSRLNDPRNDPRVMIMQRLHEDDPAGRIIEQGGYELLILPSEFDPKRRCVTSIFRDPRTTKGDLLFPELYTAEVIAQAKKDLGQAYAGQHDQNPAPEEGGMFKRNFWRFWKPQGVGATTETRRRPDGCTEDPAMALPTITKVVLSLDCAFKGKATSDRVAIGVWGVKGADRFLLDRVCKNLDFDGTVNEVRRLVGGRCMACQGTAKGNGKWGRCDVCGASGRTLGMWGVASIRFGVGIPPCLKKMIEDKANGSAVISTLKHEIGGIVEINPQGGKESRAAACQPEIQAGNVYLPEGAPWLDEYVSEFAMFPNGKHDDEVDQTTQFLNDARPTGGAALAAAAWRTL